MRWVEIMGPHGIGKTTLVKRIRKRPGMARLRIKNEVVAPFIEGKNFNRPTTWGFANDWRRFWKWWKASIGNPPVVVTLPTLSAAETCVDLYFACPWSRRLLALK